MKAYETSTTTLKSLLAHPSLQRDKIDETMDAMAEAVADHAEIDVAIRLGGEGVSAAAGTAVDENELQKELQEMIDEKGKEEAVARQLEALEKARKKRERRERGTGGERENVRRTLRDSVAKRKKRSDEEQLSRVCGRRLNRRTGSSSGRSGGRQRRSRNQRRHNATRRRRASGEHGGRTRRGLAGCRQHEPKA